MKWFGDETLQDWWRELSYNFNTFNLPVIYTGIVGVITVAVVIIISVDQQRDPHRELRTMLMQTIQAEKTTGKLTGPDKIKALRPDLEFRPDMTPYEVKLFDKFKDSKKLGDIRQALVTLREGIVLAQDGEVGEASYRELGMFYNELEDYQQALDAYTKAREANPARASNLYHMGEMNRKLKRPNRAKILLQEAVRRAPANPLYKIKLGFAQIENGEGFLLQHEAYQFVAKGQDRGIWAMLIAALLLQKANTVEAAQLLTMVEKLLDSRTFELALLDSQLAQYHRLPSLQPFYSRFAAGQVKDAKSPGTVKLDP